VYSYFCGAEERPINTITFLNKKNNSTFGGFGTQTNKLKKTPTNSTRQLTKEALV